MTNRRWLVVDGHRMHARTQSPAASRSPHGPYPDAVLVHGLGVSSRYLVPTVRALSRHRTATAVDLPGFGRSSKPEQALDIIGLADALAGWLDAAHVDRPLLVANSLGCQIIAALAARRRAVAGLVLVGPTMDSTARSWLGQSTRWLRNSLHEPPSLSLVLARDYADCGLRRPVATFAAALEDPIEEHLAEVERPVLIVRGQQDPIAPRGWRERLAAGTPRGTFVEVPGAAHTVNYSHPDALTGHIEAFVAAQVVGD